MDIVYYGFLNWYCLIKLVCNGNDYLFRQWKKKCSEQSCCPKNGGLAACIGCFVYLFILAHLHVLVSICNSAILSSSREQTQCKQGHVERCVLETQDLCVWPWNTHMCTHSATHTHIIKPPAVNSPLIPSTSFLSHHNTIVVPSLLSIC